MTFATARPSEAIPTRAALETTVDHGRTAVVTGPLRRTAMVIGDLLTAVGIVFTIPFVILAIGLPLALFGRFVGWIVGMI